MKLCGTQSELKISRNYAQAMGRSWLPEKPDRYNTSQGRSNAIWSCRSPHFWSLFFMLRHISWSLIAAEVRRIEPASSADGFAKVRPHIDPATPRAFVILCARRGWSEMRFTILMRDELAQLTIRSPKQRRNRHNAKFLMPNASLPEGRAVRGSITSCQLIPSPEFY